MHAETLLAFAAAWALLVVLPGPDTALVVARTIGRSRRAGFVAAAGSLTALTAHVAFAAVGLSAVIASSAEAFTVLKLAGAAYLIVLGLRLVLSDGEATPAEAPRTRGGFREACLTGLLNPKSALFFLTFLPQFVDRDTAAAPQFLVLGLITVAVAGAWHLGLIALAARLRTVASSPVVRARFERLTGTVFVVLGTRLAGASR
jgi:threonine/homoserine/homoserine lactone efflux protein